MELTKVKSYIGFAEKSRNVIFGADSILKSRKPKLIILSETLSDRKKLEAFALKSGAECVVVSDITLGQIVKPGVKALAIKESNLAQAITKNLTNEINC